jgi:hypothetical protein
MWMDTSQVYGGLTFMDFSGPGNGALVTRLQPSLLPPMHLIWSERPKESGKVGTGLVQGLGIAGRGA